MEEQKRSIYVEIDTMLDTRLPILYLLSKKTAEDCLYSGSYHTRNSDQFGNISAEIFYAFYNKRIKPILYMATKTPMLEVVKEHYADIVTNPMTIDHEEDYSIYLNTYPYDLTTEEIENFTTMMKSSIPDSIIKHVNMSPMELSPDWVKKNAGTLIMYQGVNWIEYWASTTELLSANLLDTQLYTPALFYRKPNIEENQIEMVTETLRLYIDFNMLQVSCFSTEISDIVNRLNKQES